MSPETAFADAYCGPAVITRSLAYSDGSVKIFAPWRGDFVTICNLKANWKGIDPQLCWSWYAKIDNAVSKGNKIGVYYGGAAPGDCATMLTYDYAPAPLYIELNP
jgi:hypothetical protein